MFLLKYEINLISHIDTIETSKVKLKEPYKTLDFVITLETCALKLAKMRITLS